LAAGASASREKREGPALHVVVAAPPSVTRPADLTAIAGCADLIELRLDLLLPHMPQVPVSAWVEAAPRPVLATLRSRREGGLFEGSPAEAAAVLLEAWLAGAAWIDAEGDVAVLLDERIERTQVVYSCHGPDAIDREARDADVGFCKRALPVDDAAALATLRQAGVVGCRAREVLVPYGRLGALRGAFFDPDRGGLLYGSVDEASAVVPGQPALRVLLDELRAGEVRPGAELFGLLGTPPTRSPSPALHNAAFRHAGRDALYLPLPGLTLRAACYLPFAGFSVTHPYKQQAHALAARRDEVAQQTGSVNTLVRAPDGSWDGYDTDALAIRALAPQAPPGASAFVYGSGGYARSACWALKAQGYRVRVGARSQEAAARLGFPLAGPSYEREAGDALVFNATPAGADGGPLPAFAAADVGGLSVFDAPYAALGGQTGLLAQAARQGAAQIWSGRRLLLAQALDQAERFAAAAGAASAAEAPYRREALARVLACALSPPPSLYLLGTRAAGKSTVGRLVARLLGRPFVDLDEAVERFSGRSPARWIEDSGWAAFREVEHEALSRVQARQGVVVALGGGVVDHAPSRASLADQGVKVLLEVDAACASARMRADGHRRPPHPGFVGEAEEAAALIARRSGAWHALADHIVDGRGTPEAVAEAVAGCWHQHRT
jgi:shikimate 5-dehydrogenase/shikimate kinase/3-dehydroquinate dehydratase